MSGSRTGRRVSRRAMLKAGVTAAAEATGLIALTGLVQGGNPAPSVAAPGARTVAGSAVGSRLVGATPVPTRAPAVTLAAHLHPWSRPVYRLDDYLHRYRHTHFPRRAIMLTIDDGPSPVWTPRYLRLLAHHQVPATFCMIGRQVHPNRSIAREVIDHGHVIANHTWSHDEALETRSDAQLRSEIERASVAIHRATGFVPAQFRAPGGVWGHRVMLELARQNMVPLGWDIDPRDWQTPGSGYIESKMLAAGPHDIILCHDGGGDRSQTYAALKRVIPALLDRGYHFVTLPAPQPSHH
jgi:peptidoglycan-N-acetylglucosamine deacetylase